MTNKDSYRVQLSIIPSGYSVIKRSVLYENIGTVIPAYKSHFFPETCGSGSDPVCNNSTEPGLENINCSSAVIFTFKFRENGYGVDCKDISICFAPGFSHSYVSSVYVHPAVVRTMCRWQQSECKKRHLEYPWLWPHHPVPRSPHFLHWRICGSLWQWWS